MNNCINKILTHIKGSKDLYELLLVCLAFGLSLLSVREARRATEISKHSLDLGRQSLSIQRDEYLVRNRPYVVMLTASIGGPSTGSSGEHYPHTIAVGLENISDIPANNVRAEYTPLLNGQKVGFTAVVAGALAKDNPLSGSMLVEDSLFQAITNSSNMFIIDALVTYSGMLGGTQNVYSTSAKIVYNRSDNKFSFMSLKYE